MERLWISEIRIAKKLNLADDGQLLIVVAKDGRLLIVLAWIGRSESAAVSELHARREVLLNKNCCFIF
jgi:hypothetical protein